MEKISLDFDRILLDVELDSSFTWNSMLGHSKEIESFHFVLYLLVLRKEGLLNESLLGDGSFLSDYQLVRDDLYNVIKEEIVNNPNKLTPAHIEFINYLDKQRLNLSAQIRFILSIKEDLFNNSFQYLFERILYRSYKYGGRKGALNILPGEVAELMGRLANLSPGMEVYNPFSGLASLGISLSGKRDYLAQEISQSINAVSILRLYAHGMLNSSNQVCGDSIEQWNPMSQKFDLIISNPPFNVKLQDRRVDGDYIANYEQFILKKGIKDLKSDGRLIILIPQGFLFRKGVDEDIRRELVDKDLLETIISLPSGILMNTNIPTTILVINKNKVRKNEVTLVDANNFLLESGRSKKLDSELLFSTIESIKEHVGLKIVKNENFKENKYDLVVQKYFAPKLKAEDGFQLISLGELVKFMRNKRELPGRLGKFVRIRDLSSDVLNYKKDFSDVETKELSNAAYEMKSKSILLSLLHNNLKPTLFSGGENIYYQANIVACQLKDTNVDIDYLMMELNSDSVLRQLKIIGYGRTISSIPKSELKNLKVLMPDSYFNKEYKESLAVQRASYEAYKNGFIKKAEQELKIQKELLGFKEEAFREMASIRHSLSQYLNALKSNVIGTRKFIDKNQGQSFSFDTIYSKNLKQTFGEHLLSTESTIDSMANLISQFDSNYSEEESIYDLEKLIKDAQNRFKHPDIFMFEELHKDIESFTNEDTFFEPMIVIADEDFYRIFSNIVSNAVDHGFKKPDQKYIIRTSLEYESETKMCVFEISNNGEPVDDKFSEKRLITRGEKTSDSLGSGTGGADIKEIVAKYHGSFTWNTDPQNDFPVSYIIKLPIVKNDENGI